MATRDPIDPPLERGSAERDVDRASLDATERLRARLSGQPLPRPRQAPRSSLPWVIAGGLFVFTTGMVANPWFEAAVRNRLPFAATLGPRLAEDADVAAMQARIDALERRLATAPAPAERLARTEAKIETSSDQLAREAERVDKLTAELGALSAAVAADRARSDAVAGVATATALRAESLLTLLMTRRALAEGRTLGGLDAELRRLFEARFPKPVTAIAAIGAAPVTRAALLRDFAALRPGLGTRDPAARLGWWTALRTAVVGAVGRGEALPADLAAAALARGDVAAAAAALRRQSATPSPELADWLAAADRLVAGEAALAILDNAVLLPPPAVAPAPVPQRLPNNAVPTRTTAAPSSTAVS